MKTLEQLALETVMPDGGETTEYQENEISALVKFGKLVLENASLPTQRPPDGFVCTACGETFNNKWDYCLRCGQPLTTRR